MFPTQKPSKEAKSSLFSFWGKSKRDRKDDDDDDDLPGPNATAGWFPMLSLRGPFVADASPA